MNLELNSHLHHVVLFKIHPCLLFFFPWDRFITTSALNLYKNSEDVQVQGSCRLTTKFLVCYYFSLPIKVQSFQKQASPRSCALKVLLEFTVWLRQQTAGSQRQFLAALQLFSLEISCRKTGAFSENIFCQFSLTARGFYVS